MTRPRSFRARVTAWYVGFVAVLLVALGLAVYLIVRDTLIHSLEESLEQWVERNRAGVVVGADGLSLTTAGDQRDDDVFVRLFDLEGEVGGSGAAASLPVRASTLAAARGGSGSRYDLRGAGESYRVQALPVRADGAIVGVLEIGVSRGDTDDALRTLRIVLLVAVPLTLVAAGAGGLVIARRALRPIREMTQRAEEMSAQSLDRRIDHQGPPDELGQLAATLDRMLARLEDAFDRQRQFTGDAAHELRTPLTAIRGQIDVALQRERGAGAYREVLERVGGQTERLIRLVESLLLLARADAGQIVPASESVDLRLLGSEVVTERRVAADAASIRLDDVGGPAVVVPGDRVLLRQLLENLVDNALTATPDGGAVQVEVAQVPGGAELRVSDSGEGVPEEALDRIFDRFYRVEGARSRRDGGAGLGLAICRWIAGLHGGTVVASNREAGGAELRVFLPVE